MAPNRRTTTAFLLLFVALLALAAEAKVTSPCKSGCKGKHGRVCASNGQTYQNACLAKCQGLTIVSQKPCEGSPAAYLSSTSDGTTLSQADMERFKDEGFTLLGVATASTFDPAAAYKQFASEPRSKAAGSAAAAASPEHLTAVRYEFATGLVYATTLTPQQAAKMVGGKEVLGQHSDAYSGPVAESAELLGDDAANKTSRRLNHVFLPDDRRQITTSGTFPTRSIGHLTFSDASRANYQCSGAMISARSVLTAGHCVFDRPTRAWQTNFVFMANQVGNTKPYGSSTGAFVTTFSAWTNTASASDPWAYDIAVVQLANTNYGSATGWMGIEWVSSYTGPMTTSGYPGDKKYNTFWTTSCRVTQNAAKDNGLIPHTCDIYQGQSGSPMYVFKNSQYYIRGVVSNEVTYTDRSRMNFGAAITSTNFNVILGWR